MSTDLTTKMFLISKISAGKFVLCISPIVSMRSRGQPVCSSIQKGGKMSTSFSTTHLIRAVE